MNIKGMVIGSAVVALLYMAFVSNTFSLRSLQVHALHALQQAERFIARKGATPSETRVVTSRTKSKAEEVWEEDTEDDTNLFITDSSEETVSAQGSANKPRISASKTHNKRE